MIDRQHRDRLNLSLLGHPKDDIRHRLLHLRFDRKRCKCKAMHNSIHNIQMNTTMRNTSKRWSSRKRNLIRIKRLKLELGTANDQRIINISSNSIRKLRAAAHGSSLKR